jgi:hypothetical protein
MNKTVLKLLVGLVALSLAGCAAFFSIVGLSKLFAGAALAVIIMATTLEGSKLVIASFLYQSWNTISKVLRIYLVIAMIIIATITSIGIYGFLSGAYQTTKSSYDLTQTQTDSLKVQQAYYESSVVTFKSQLESKNNQLVNLTSIRSSQELRANQLVTNKRSTRAADNSAKATDASIALINGEIDLLNKKIIAYSDSASKMNIAATQVGLKNDISSELGSLAYISNVLNVSMDKVVNVLIILFIIVFDPLAICMVLVFNFMNTKSEDNNFSKEDINSNEPEFFVTSTVEASDYIAEQPSEQPLEQSESIDQVIIPQELVEDVKTEDIAIPTAIETHILSDIEKKRMEKQLKAQRLYSGVINVDNSETKTY